MSSFRIDQLRSSLHDVGQKQLSYWKFFTPFSSRLEQELGDYLGDPDSVALSSAKGDFSFDHGSYHQSGIGFKNGKFMIPLMFRLQNIHDEGETLLRIFPLFIFFDGKVTVEFEGQSSLTSPITDITSILEYIYISI